MIIEKLESIVPKERKPWPRAYFYVSEVGECPRKLFYLLKGFPRAPPEARIVRCWDNGKDTHKRLLTSLKTLGLVQDTEVSTPQNGLFRGRADAVLQIEGRRYILEIKSASPYLFQKASPDPSHLNQLQLYLHFLNCDQGILLYENKADQKLKEFVVHRDEALIRSLIEKFQYLKEQIDKGEVPAVPQNIEPWRCRFCPFKEVCENGKS